MDQTKTMIISAAKPAGQLGLGVGIGILIGVVFAALHPETFQVQLERAIMVYVINALFSSLRAPSILPPI